LGKKKTASQATERLNLYLDSDLAKKLNDYCVAVTNERHKIISNIKQKIGRKALEEWLEKHGDDLTIEL
jgi:post-segregation antitoxin (ccd killing protein)